MNDQRLGDPPPDDTLDAELARCEAGWDNELSSGLAELLAVPEDLAQRTTRKLGDALLTRSTLATAIDLLGLGWHTIRHLSGATDVEEPR